MKFWFILAILLTACRAIAATKYVDNSGSPTCANNPTNGSEAAPFCTVQYGISQISGGDTLYVKNGTYDESFTISGPTGTSPARTVISAYPGHTPVLQGTSTSAGRMKITGTAYIDFVGFEITRHNQCLYIDDDAGTGSPADNIRAYNIIAHNCGQEGVAIRGDVHDILLDHCTVYDTGQLGTGSNGEGVYVGGGTSPDNSNAVTIQYCTIHDVQDEGVELKHGSHDVIVQNNTLYNCMDPGSSFSTTGGCIEINETDGEYGSNPNHLVRNNIIHGIPIQGGVTKRGIRAGTGSTVYNNVLYDLPGVDACVLINNNSSDAFTRNIYHNTCAASVFTVAAGTTNLTNNIGTTASGNVAYSSAYFVDAAGGNFHLLSGSVPVNAGSDLTATVPTDLDGVSRSVNAPPDHGAYEYAVAIPSARGRMRR